MDLTPINEYLFNPSSFSLKTLQGYTRLLSADFKGRSRDNQHITSEFIHLLLNIPFYISEKILAAIGTGTSHSIEEFLSFYETLFTGDINCRARLLFDIFDLDKDGTIHAVDVLFILEKFFVLKYGREHDKEFKSVMKGIERDIQSSMTGDEFIDYIALESSDVFYLFFLFMHEANLYKENYLKQYAEANDEDKGVKKKAFNRMRVKEPSMLMTRFAKEVIGDECEISVNEEDDTDAEDLQALEDFETALCSCLASLKKDKSVTCIYNKSKLFLNDFSNGPMRIPKKSLTKEPSILPLQLLSISNHAVDYSKSLQTEGIKIHCESEHSTRRVVLLIDNVLFIKKRSPQRTSSQIVSMLSLNNIFTSSLRQYPIQSSKVYYQAKLTSVVSGDIMSITFFSAKTEKLSALIALINRKRQYRDVYDYYYKDRLILKGTYGEMYEATNKETNSKVAMKVISKVTPQSISYWEREVFTVIQHNPHPNVVTCIDSFETKENVFLIFEYMSMGTLRGLMQKNDIDNCEEQQLSFVNQLIAAVSFLHDNGIIHRDLKPDNLLITQQQGLYGLKLTDFGFSKLLAPNETATESYGSLVYSAPEVLKGSPYSLQPDIWSIGMMTYFIYSSIDPFDTIYGDCAYIRTLILSFNVEFLYFKLTRDERIVKLIKSCLKRDSRPQSRILYIK